MHRIRQSLRYLLYLEKFYPSHQGHADDRGHLRALPDPEGLSGADPAWAQGDGQRLCLSRKAGSGRAGGAPVALWRGGWGGIGRPVQDNVSLPGGIRVAFREGKITEALGDAFGRSGASELFRVRRGP